MVDKVYIYNRTKNKLIHENAEIANTPFKRSSGLMFRAKQEKPMLFIFDSPGIYSIHSFFVFFTFDAVYINEKKEIVEIIKNIKPSSLINPKNISLYLLEIPTSLSEKLSLSIGDKLEFTRK
ncbi:DUF192 domain-containing protein [Candidatus Micrarchaeota archaeon]|nr:DUF192 domain-containing protein [Candidatus Micrarchaeota archaeon]